MSIDDKDQIYGQFIEVLFELDRFIRADIIYRVVVIEGLIEGIIAHHFCRQEDQHPFFISLLFRDGQITFSQKITILKKLLSQCYPDLFEEFRIIFSRLEKIRELRNKFAHSELVLPSHPFPKEPPHGICLRRYKNGKVIEELVTANQAGQIIGYAEGLQYLLLFLKQEIDFRVSGIVDPSSRVFFDLIKRKWPDLLTQKKP